MPLYHSYVLNPLIEAEKMSAEEAQKRLKVCPRTLFTYAQKLPISRHIGRHRVYSEVAVEMLRDADLDALHLYAEGERVDPRVRRYYDRLGIALPAFLFAGA